MNARRLTTATAVALACLASARPAAPAEISAFVSNASPGDTWRRGYGGMLTISLFSIVHGELEGARQPGEAADTSLLTGHAKAYVGPTIGALVPYAGLGAGVYHEGLPVNGSNGTFGSVFAGVKVKFPMGIVVRGEYQRIGLPSGIPVKLDKRYFLALGLHI